MTDCNTVCERFLLQLSVAQIVLGWVYEGLWEPSRNRISKSKPFYSSEKDSKTRSPRPKAVALYYVRPRDYVQYQLVLNEKQFKCMYVYVWGMRM